MKNALRFRDFCRGMELLLCYVGIISYAMTFQDPGKLNQPVFHGKQEVLRCFFFFSVVQVVVSNIFEIFVTLTWRDAR